MKLQSVQSLLSAVVLLSMMLPNTATALSVCDFVKREAFDYGTSEIINNFKSKSDKGSTNKNQNDDSTKHEQPIKEIPCSTHHPLTNGFYDLSDLSSIDKESHVAWSSRGYDYNSNFTLGICSSPLKANIDVNNNYQGIGGDKINSSEVGGFYTDADGQKFSIGNFNSTPIFRGKKLTLTYTGGSYCPNKVDKKSTILSFTCDKEILQKASVSFVGVLHDCDYFFEVRTIHACPTAQKADNLAVIWIFLFILLAALFVYCSGGFLYKRIVLNRRGWKQIPTYSLGSKVSSAFSGNWNGVNRKNSNINLETNGDRFGFIDDQNDLLDALDADSE